MDQPASEVEGIRDVITSILSRNKEGSLTDPRARGALAAFLTSYAPDGYFDDRALVAFDVYLDITLQLSKRSAADDPIVEARLDTLVSIALGDVEKLGSIRSVA